MKILLEIFFDKALAPNDITVDSAILPIVLKKPFLTKSPDIAASTSPPVTENIACATKPPPSPPKKTRYTCS